MGIFKRKYFLRIISNLEWEGLRAIPLPAGDFDSTDWTPIELGYNHQHPTAGALEPLTAWGHQWALKATATADVGLVKCALPSGHWPLEPTSAAVGSSAR